MVRRPRSAVADGPQAPLAQACLAVTCVWGLLLVGAVLSLGLLPTYAVVCAFTLALRPGQRARLGRASLALGAAAGFVSYPAWIALVVSVGLALGLAPGPPTPAQVVALEPLLALVLLGPVFEELLYREKLLGALTARLHPTLAVLASAACFALPHLEPWTVLTTFLLGLALGAIFLCSRNIAPCVGMHMGLNLAAMTGGVPPTRWALGPVVGAILGALLTALAIRVRS
jgi:membrane protease YdiL (CAAX protease family)